MVATTFLLSASIKNTNAGAAKRKVTYRPFVGARKKLLQSKRETLSGWKKQKSEWNSSANDYTETLWQVGDGAAKPFAVKVDLDGVQSHMEIDTGASVSLISEVTFKKLAKQGATLHPCDTKLTTYTGEAIRAMGTTNVRVTYEDQDISLPLLVTEGNGPSLIARNWLMNLKLNWKELFVVKSEKTLEDILSQNAEVFGDENWAP